jgi:prostaglandin-endoperoxide synthase 2
MARLTTQPADLLPLFERQGAMRTDRSSALFMFFAQWFTDSVLRVNQEDRRRNTSNHDIDLCQIYGLDEATARLLRSGQGGRLACQTINGQVFPDYLYEQGLPAGELRVKQQYRNLPYIAKLDLVFDGVAPERRVKAYATGLERGNSTIGYAAISTMFLREHNRLAGELAARNPGWDDERLFQTARMINIVLLMKVVVEDYINHIAGKKIFKLDASFAEDQEWYRTNWIAIEFDMLYRWHSLVPDAITVAGQQVAAADYRNNNALLEQQGLGGVLAAASAQVAGRIGLGNSPAFLKQADLATLTMARAFRLRSYNDYRERFGLERMDSLDELTSDPTLLAKLKQYYQGIDDVELLVGMLAEDRHSDALFGDLLNTMVAYDAFTQIFTNPLLSRNVFNEASFSAYGLEVINGTCSVADIAKRNNGGEIARLDVNAV